jgi:hypothetical protein
MITDPIHGNRATFPTPNNNGSADLYKIAGEVLKYGHEWGVSICVNPSGNGFTFYLDSIKEGNSFAGLQPGGLLLDPSVKKRVCEETPPIINEGLEAGWLTEIDADNFKSSFRVRSPLGPTLTPPQVAAVRASLQIIQRDSPIS